MSLLISEVTNEKIAFAEKQMTLGERIKSIRGEMSREKFAPLTGIGKTALVTYEKDERVPDARYLNKLLELNPDINPTWLLTGHGPMRWELSDKKRLSVEAIIEKLKNRLRITTRPIDTWYMHFPDQNENSYITDKEFRDFLGGRYIPTLEQLLELCNRAGSSITEEDKEVLRAGSLQPVGEIKLDPLEKDCKLIREIVELYEHMRHEKNSEDKARDIALIYRYFKEHSQPYWDEVEICHYIDEWF